MIASVAAQTTMNRPGLKNFDDDADVSVARENFADNNFASRSGMRPCLACEISAQYIRPVVLDKI
jgi:hypothetical protein